MLFENFKSNPFAAKCETAQENHYETSLVPGRQIAAAAAVSNEILPGGKRFFYAFPTSKDWFCTL